MYTIELANITIQTNSANREKEAATAEVTKVHGAVGQYCTSTPQGPGGRFWPFQRPSGLRGPCQDTILHRECQSWLGQASKRPSRPGTIS